MTRGQCFVGLLASLLLVCPLFGQTSPSMSKRLTNQDIISMVQMGLSEDVIVAKIRAVSSEGADGIGFDTSVEGLKALKAARVPDSVIRTMIDPAAGLQATNNTPSGPTTANPNLPPPEVGVYWKDGGNFSLLQGQAVTQTKVGGKAGSFFTNGLRNQHWDAYIEGPKSKNIVKERRPTFYFYVPDGADASDYVLIKLSKKTDHREFEIGSFGGIRGGKSGVKKEKEIPFNAEHAGIRVYRITLDADLKPGEYGFFMGTGQSATMSGAHGGNRSGGSASGRIYDFSVPE